MTVAQLVGAVCLCERERESVCVCASLILPLATISYLFLIVLYFSVPETDINTNSQMMNNQLLILSCLKIRIDQFHNIFVLAAANL